VEAAFEALAVAAEADSSSISAAVAGEEAVQAPRGLLLRRHNSMGQAQVSSSNLQYNLENGWYY